MTRDTDAPRRFFVREFRADRQQGWDQQGWEIVDRTGFLSPARFAAGITQVDNARHRAVEVATARNECELAGAHVWEVGGEGCEVCDATCKPDLERRHA